MSVPFLRLSGVTKKFGDRAAVLDVSLHVQPGESVVILGPSGCGKTTLLRLIAGLERPDEGEIRIRERLVARGRHSAVPPHERQLGFVFQDLALWPHLTVGGNLRFVMASVGVPRGERNQRESEMLHLLHINHLAERYPHELSGGEQQRAALARSIVARPALLLLDEPFSCLDPELRGEMRVEFARLHGALKLTTIYVTHDRDDAAALANRVVEMGSGRILADAPVPRREARS